MGPWTIDKGHRSPYGHVEWREAAQGRVTFTKVSVGFSHSCPVTSAGAAMCWGNNESGQLGDGTTIERHRQVPVAGLGRGVRSVEAGAYSSCALMMAGEVRCWGWSGGHGSLGTGVLNDHSLVRVRVRGPGDVIWLDGLDLTMCVATRAGAA